VAYLGEPDPLPATPAIDTIGLLSQIATSEVIFALRDREVLNLGMTLFGAIVPFFHRPDSQLSLLDVLDMPDSGAEVGMTDLI
jgi:hypothetical protein